jgi:asparagine synthase (glutamine-hydrolysing)
VILSGDGGDELFAGYDSYRTMSLAEQYRRLPGWLGSQVLPGLVQAMGQSLPAGRRYGALRVAKVLRDSGLPFESMYFSKSTLVNNDLLSRLLVGDWAARVKQDGQSYYPCDIERVIRSDLPIVSKASYANIRFRLLDGMLVKVDRMSMANSLEVRSPLLDHRLVEFAASLPPSLKLRGWQTKAILRDTVRRYLPPRTMRKSKQGFSVPLRDWLRTSLREMVGDYLDAGGGHLPQGVFDRSTIRTLLREHRRGEVDHSTTIWLLLNYAAWHDLYVRGLVASG